MGKNRLGDITIDIHKNNFKKPDRFLKPVRFGTKFRFEISRFRKSFKNLSETRALETRVSRLYI
ncbi:hypothetical protein QUF82_20700 [Thiotrichales bacterium HSG14]|nr:hypothetical protein [Thiotrichales bacterium HSG14]